jgi:hypothetical protein
MMLVSERRELVVKALQGAFPGREFCIADILKRTTQPELSIALTANFAQGWGKLPPEVVGIKIGRLLQEKIAGRKFGEFELTSLGKRGGDVNYYRIGPPSPPKAVPFLVIERLDGDGHLHQTILKDSKGRPIRAVPEAPPVVDKPAEAPKPAPVATGPPPKWRQPTRAELKARHDRCQIATRPSNDWSHHGAITPQRRDLNL